MKFYLLRSDGGIGTASGGCFGCLGRTDSYMPRVEVLEVVRKFNSKAGHSTSIGDTVDCFKNKDTDVIRLKRDWLSFRDGILTHSLKSYAVVEYLVHRSPWRSAFASTVQSIFETDVIDLHAKGVPSELVISLGFVLRVCESPDVHLTYALLARTNPELPEFFRFFMCIAYPYLYRGEGSSRLYEYNRDGVIFPKEASPKAILDPENHLAKEGQLCPLSINDIGGYCMNITSMWRDSSVKEQIGHLCDTSSDQFYTVSQVKGVFGSLNAQGIVNVKGFVQSVYDAFKGAE